MKWTLNFAFIVFQFLRVYVAIHILHYWGALLCVVNCNMGASPAMTLFFAEQQLSSSALLCGCINYFNTHPNYSGYVVPLAELC